MLFISDYTQSEYEGQGDENIQISVWYMLDDMRLWINLYKIR